MLSPPLQLNKTALGTVLLLPTLPSPVDVLLGNESSGPRGEGFSKHWTKHSMLNNQLGCPQIASCLQQYL